MRTRTGTVERVATLLSKDLVTLASSIQVPRPLHQQQQPWHPLPRRRRLPADPVWTSAQLVKVAHIHSRNLFASQIVAPTDRPSAGLSQLRLRWSSRALQAPSASSAPRNLRLGSLGTAGPSTRWRSGNCRKATLDHSKKRNIRKCRPPVC